MNSAASAGAKIGRQYPDIWVPDEVLLDVIDVELLPLIKLHKSSEDRRADELRPLLGVVVVLAIACGAFLALLVAPDSVVSLPAPLGRLAAPIGVAFGLFVLLSILVTNWYRRARDSAREQRHTTIRGLRDAAFRGAVEALNRRRAKAGMPMPSHIQRDALAPDRMPTGVTPRGAEELVAQWMRHLGDTAAETTQFQGDGGVDVAGTRFIAQVKHFSGSVGVAPIRELTGVAMMDGRRALFFTSTGYSTGAVEFADRAGVALFVYIPEEAGLLGMNGLAKTLMVRGLGELAT